LQDILPQYNVEQNTTPQEEANPQINNMIIGEVSLCYLTPIHLPTNNNTYLTWYLIHHDPLNYQSAMLVQPATITFPQQQIPQSSPVHLQESLFQ
jgi:hypothetical protein